MKPKYSSISKFENYNKRKEFPKKPKPKKEEQEFGKPLKDLIICSDCGAIYSKKRWIFDPLFLKSLKKTKKGLNINDELSFSLCPACKMIKNNMFEGEITILGFKEKDRKSIIKVAENYAEKRAKERDALDRISKIKNLKNKLIIYTTENKLAMLIAKQIQSAFKKYKIEKEIKFSHKEDVVRIDLNFKEKKK